MSINIVYNYNTRYRLTIRSNGTGTLKIKKGGSENSEEARALFKLSTQLLKEDVPKTLRGALDTYKDQWAIIMRNDSKSFSRIFVYEEDKLWYEKTRI